MLISEADFFVLWQRCVWFYAVIQKNIGLIKLTLTTWNANVELQTLDVVHLLE